MHTAIQVLADTPVYLTWGWVSVSVPNLIAIPVSYTHLTLPTNREV